jgi:hypothetical protein
MASRWMQQVKQRQRQYKKKLGNLSITKREEKFYKRKILINKLTGQVIRVESIDDHLERMYREAKEEREHPVEPTRIVARILQIESIRSLPLNHDERKLISRMLIHVTRADGTPTGEIILSPEFTIADVEKSILRYRRLTNREEEERKAKGEQEQRRKQIKLRIGKLDEPKSGKKQTTNKPRRQGFRIIWQE